MAKHTLKSWFVYTARFLKNVWPFSNIEGTVMQIEKVLIMIASVFHEYPENYAFKLYIILQEFTCEICYFI